MTAIFIPFSQSSSQAMPALKRTRDPAAASVESAKNYLSTRLAQAQMLSFREKVLVQRFGEAIMDGDLPRLQRCLLDLGEMPARQEVIVNLVAGELHTPGVAFLPLQIARWRFSDSEELQEVAVFSMQLINAKRILAIATDDRFGPHVYGRDNGLIEELNEDPRILFKQIGRLVASGLTTTPPPFTSST